MKDIDRVSAQSGLILFSVKLIGFVATIFTSIEPICLGIKINDIGSELLPQLHISLGLLTISYASEVSNLS
jgi:hypothetical protein